MKISETFNWKRITPDNGHYFFGYYDRNPADEPPSAAGRTRGNRNRHG